MVGLKDGKPYADEMWPPILNRELDPLALAQLLWRDEAIELLEYFGMATGMRGKSRKVLWKSLATRLSVEQLEAFVCYKLRTRKGWRGYSKSQAVYRSSTSH